MPIKIIHTCMGIARMRTRACVWRSLQVCVRVRLHAHSHACASASVRMHVRHPAGRRLRPACTQARTYGGRPQIACTQAAS